MRSQTEIVARMNAVEKEDFFGFRREVLLGALDFEHAKEWLTADATENVWVATATDAEVRTAAASYLRFAWGKVEDHRGLSAGRSVEKLAEFAWLMGDEKLLGQVEQAGYAQYGAPKLKVFSEAWGAAIPDSEPLLRMMRGEPCRPDCNEGCGQ